MAFMVQARAVGFAAMALRCCSCDMRLDAEHARRCMWCDHVCCEFHSQLMHGLPREASDCWCCVRRLYLNPAAEEAAEGQGEEQEAEGEPWEDSEEDAAEGEAQEGDAEDPIA